MELYEKFHHYLNFGLNFCMYIWRIAAIELYFWMSDQMYIWGHFNLQYNVHVNVLYSDETYMGDTCCDACPQYQMFQMTNILRKSWANYNPK